MDSEGGERGGVGWLEVTGRMGRREGGEGDWIWRFLVDSIEIFMVFFLLCYYLDFVCRISVLLFSFCGKPILFCFCIFWVRKLSKMN